MTLESMTESTLPVSMTNLRGALSLMRTSMQGVPLQSRRGTSVRNLTPAKAAEVDWAEAGIVVAAMDVNRMVAAKSFWTRRMRSEFRGRAGMVVLFTRAAFPVCVGEAPQL